MKLKLILILKEFINFLRKFFKKMDDKSNNTNNKVSKGIYIN